jgi:hypothetical protein
VARNGQVDALAACPLLKDQRTKFRSGPRPLREVGGVSRNRLLVDKMIVWRTILGLIMASKWPAPESQSARRFQMTDVKGS